MNVSLRPLDDTECLTTLDFIQDMYNISSG